MDAEYRQLAWAAGFLDGEGCFSLTKRGSQSEWYRAPIIHACQIRKENLDVLAGLFGGVVRPMRTNDRGEQIWQWSLSGSTAIVEAIERLLPFLVGKHDEAVAVLAWCRTIKRRGRRGVPTLVTIRRRQIIKQFERAREVNS